jgi:UDP-glucose 4-epimerase
MNNKKKIIIFGATGNTGSYLVDYALNYFDSDEYEVIASGRRQTDFFNKRGIEYYSVDITNEQEFSRLPDQNVYAVMLLSAQIPSYMNVYEPRKYIDSIIIGSYNVLEFCRKNKVDRIIYTQTVFDVSSYSHEMVVQPTLPRKFSYMGDHAMYVISKNTAIEFIEHYHQEYGLKKFIFRLPTIYSYSPYPYYFPNGVKTMRPIYQMINKAIKSEPLEIWGDPNYAKDMVHVNDFSQMLCKSVEVNRQEGLYNVGTGIPITLEKQIRTIVDVFSPQGHPSPILYRPEKPSTGGFLMDISNAKDELGYEPQYDCRKLLEDYKKEMVLNKFAELRNIDI